MAGQSETCDVLVVGGRPAGAAIAIRLSGYGFDVCIAEQAQFPRRHIGESLPPAILTVLDQLNLRDRIEAAGFLRPCGSIVKWGDGAPTYRKVSGSAGFQVDRAQFQADSIGRRRIGEDVVDAETAGRRLLRLGRLRVAHRQGAAPATDRRPSRQSEMDSRRRLLAPRRGCRAPGA